MAKAEGGQTRRDSKRMVLRPRESVRADENISINTIDILELVRYQKKEMPLAAGAEELIYSATQMLSAERRNRNRFGKLADMPVYSIPYTQIKKIAALKNHIWGL